MARIHRIIQKDLHEPDNHNGVITHLEPDILEWEIKWALGSITKNKVSGVMEFQLSYFKSWKMMLWKCCTQYASKFGRLGSGHRTGKGQFSFQSQRKAMKRMLKFSSVAQLCPTLCNPMNCNLPVFPIHGIFQARVLEWVAISFSRGSSWPRDQTLPNMLLENSGE